MSEPVWYYAEGDTEKGPVSLARLKSLIDGGRITGDDLVWTEGMDDWQPASRVPGLLHEAPPAPPGETQTDIPSPQPRRAATFRTADPHRSPASVAPRSHTPVWPSLTASRWLLAAGLLIVLLAQGCDLVARRQVDRLQGMAQVHRDQFQDDWDRRRIALEDQLQELRESSEVSAGKAARDRQLRAELAELNEQMQARQSEYARHEWRYDEIAARDARANYQMGAYWRSWLFFLGALLLVGGLLATARSASGAEAWLSWIMLAIIVYSLFVGGSAWSPPVLDVWRPELSG